ncbi:c649eda8-b650-49c9-bcda-c68ba110dcd3 [Thermothielavioides terrestris]|uniref:C649eda8-b650-49c9-bcda-c68ba110dcd3 n=1 Tax=Thermothielavioides terrestris TaxID=2587410 RepID=A0A3S4BPX1_9PEZI|nr:c649eda8-b650-49c9-bcda-c68ba110dcd3 [Thermothielavioides terrestris]
MEQAQTQPAASSVAASLPADQSTPQPIAVPAKRAASGRLISRLAVDTYSPVNQNGSFEFDRVIKSGYVQKRSQKTKTWRTIYLVLRPNTLSIYKSDKEEKLRHKIYLSDLTAVTLLKDPKNKRQNVFGLFSPSKNYHFQAPTLKDAQEWVDLVRQDARIDEEEDEMFLASPVVHRPSFFQGARSSEAEPTRILASPDRFPSSSPEPPDPPIRGLGKSYARRPSQMESSGLSGADLASPSDFSDSDVHRIPGASFESLAVQHPSTSPGPSKPALAAVGAHRISVSHHEADPDRVIWQGWMWFHRSKGGVRQWKKSWGVLRPRNLILYKDEAESSVVFVLYMSSIVNVVDTDPLSRTKRHCLQIITDEKSYRFCTHDEEDLVQCLGAFKSLLAKRRELEAKAGTASATASAALAATTATTAATTVTATVAEARLPPA